MAQKFSFRPGTGITRSRGAPTLTQRSQRFFVDAQNFSGRDFRAAKDGEVELVDGNAKPLRRGDQFPGEGDGVFLEIIAEGKISEHLEKRVMAVGEADVFQVVVLAAGAHAFLRRRGARVVALLEAQENILELVHPGVGEQQRGVVRSGPATNCARCDGRASAKNFRNVLRISLPLSKMTPVFVIRDS